MEAKFDTADEHPQTESQRLNARIEQLRNLDIVDPKSDWNRVYSIGRQAYIDGDFRRAFNAFQLALMRMDNVPPNDPRVAMTQAAIKQIGKNADTTSARAGFKANGGKIQTVFSGSLAWLAGVRAGDGIASARANGALINLTVTRSGKSHAVVLHDLTISTAEEAQPRLKGSAANSSSALTKLDATVDKDKPLNGHVTDFRLLAQNEKLLDNHDLVILIDKSGSMREEATPGLSKWDWCKANTLNLLETAGKHFENHITIVPFDTRFEVFENADLNKVGSVYQEFSPMGGTRPDGALSYELEQYFARRQRNRITKPLIIAVLTDGLPNDPDALRDVIFDATMRMTKPDEICISFLQVGDSFSGSRILTALDDYLVDAGARHDIVDTTTFYALQKIGIKNALVSALMDAAASCAEDDKSHEVRMQRLETRFGAMLIEATCSILLRQLPRAGFADFLRRMNEMPQVLPDSIFAILDPLRSAKSIHIPTLLPHPHLF